MALCWIAEGFSKPTNINRTHSQDDLHNKFMKKRLFYLQNNWPVSTNQNVACVTKRVDLTTDYSSTLIDSSISQHNFNLNLPPSLSAAQCPVEHRLQALINDHYATIEMPCQPRHTCCLLLCSHSHFSTKPLHDACIKLVQMLPSAKFTNNKDVVGQTILFS